MSLISESDVRAVGRRAALQANSSADDRLRHLSASKPDGAFDIFLSHSYSDAELILGLRETISSMGFSVYVDWLNDAHLKRSETSRLTAALLRRRMANSRGLFYATSIAATVSRWMPWECGYFDGLRGKVAICPLTTTPQPDDEYSGQEYLGLYPYVSRWRREGDQEPTLWIHESATKYVNLAWWLGGGTTHEPHVSR